MNMNTEDVIVTTFFYFQSSLFGITFVFSFVSLVFILVTIDPQMFTSIFEDLLPNPISIFGNYYELCDCTDLTYCFSCPRCEFVDVIDVIVLLLRQVVAWIIHIIICVLFATCFGFNCSLGCLLYKAYDEYKGTLESTSSYFATDMPKNIQIFLFSNKWKKNFESAFGKIYLKQLSKSKDKMLRICSLNYVLSQPEFHYVPPNKHSTIAKYLREKRHYCFAGVTLQSIKNNVCFYILYNIHLLFGIQCF